MATWLTAWVSFPRILYFSFMKSIFFVVGISFLFSTNAFAWQKLETGLFYQKTEVVSAGNPVVIHAIKVDPENFTVRPIFNKQVQFAKTHAEQQNALLAINANFFDPQGQALGLVKQNNVVLNPKKDVSWWSVLCIHKSTAKIIHQAKYTEAQCEHAVEAGPRLVVDGTIPALKDENSYKTAVGINTSGDIIMIATADPIPIKELAQIFTQPESKNGFDCPNVLNLDGGSSTQMYVKTNSFELNVPSLIKFPAGLGVFRK